MCLVSAVVCAEAPGRAAVCPTSSVPRSLRGLRWLVFAAGLSAVGLAARARSGTKLRKGRRQEKAGAHLSASLLLV